MKTSVVPDMWLDPRFAELAPKDKVVWIFMITGPHMKESAGGLVCLRFDSMFDQLRRSFGGNWIMREDLERTLRNINDSELTFYDREHEVMLIPNWIKHNRPQSPKNMLGYIKHLSRIPPCSMCNDWLDIMKNHCLERGKSWCETFDDNFEQRYVDIKKPQEEQQSLFAGMDHAGDGEPPAWCLAVSAMMRDEMRKHSPRRIVGRDTTRWAWEIEKIERLDGYSQQDIRYVAKWVYTDEFWHKVILSGANLRKHFARLIDKAHDQSAVDADPFAALEG